MQKLEPDAPPPEPADQPSGLDLPAVSEAEAADAIENAEMPDAHNDPVKEFIFLPQKGHTTANVMEFYMMAVWKLVGLPPPGPGGLRFIKITEEYARSLSPETQQFVRQLQPTPPVEPLPAGMTAEAMTP